MGLLEDIQQIAKRYFEAREAILTEEATKTALVIPFIRALGYDDTNPLEVIPEYNAEITGKKGDKVDYVIFKDNVPAMVIECKKHDQELNVTQESQLLRYFTALPGDKVAILTNGVQYRFYAGLDEKNKMDKKPFFQFDITALNASNSDFVLKELAQYTKPLFNIGAILSVAEELKYTGAIKKFLSDCLNEPSDAFVVALAKQVYDGRLVENMREKFKDITKKAFSQFISDRVSDRLSFALQEEKASAVAQDVPLEDDGVAEESRIVTTQEEIDAYNIIKAILCKSVDAARVTMRDTISYCGILLDDNNRKPIARLYFNNPNNMQIGIFDGSKAEVRQAVKSPNDIYQYSDLLVKNIADIDSKTSGRKSSDGQEDL